jgi:2-methylcitrate dehydratase PrpD
VHAPAARSHTTPDFAAVFADWSAELKISELPPRVVKAARTNLFDTLACAVAGRNAPGVSEVRDLVLGWGARGEASLWWSDARLPAHDAAWVNGIMAHARDYDDTHDAAVLHAGVSVVPAALAAADIAGRPVTGGDLLAGLVAGLELICRLGMATRIGIIESGFIYSGLFGHFAATAAAARVLRLTPAETVNAMGIAYSQAGGTHQVTRDGATTKRMQPGFGARSALLSIAMSQAGIRGAQKVFEGEDGLGRTYLRSALDSEALRDGLGQRFHMADLSYKPYPCCRFNHSAIDAALSIAREPGFEANRVRRITVGTNRQAWEAVACPLEIRQAPVTVVQAQFSICYTIACALVNCAVGLEDFADSALRRPNVAAIARKVEPYVDPMIESEWGRTISPVELVVETDHSVFRTRVDHARGGLGNAMGPEDFDRKLRDSLAFSSFPKANATHAAFHEVVGRLPDCPDVSRAFRELTTLGFS